jgi:hypothetical protein
MKRIISTICLTALALIVSCSSPINAVSEEVASVLIQMHEDGQLPGIAKSEFIEHVQTAAFPHDYKLKYPTSVTLYAYKTKDAIVYIYTFSKETADSQWHLTSAARRTEEGEREEMPIK